jgi:hypothetical protein
MAYLLRFLILIMITGILLTTLKALGWIELPIGHIQMAIPAFLFLIFVQAFVMFYFIGTSRLTDNIQNILMTEKNLHDIFEKVPADLEDYKKTVNKFVNDTTLSKRKTIPWTMMMLTLGMLAFLLGGAHDTGLVEKIIHSGVVYGFLAAMLIGFYKQWNYLGKNHLLLRNLKSLFSLPDNQM